MTAAAGAMARAVGSLEDLKTADARGPEMEALNHLLLARDLGLITQDALDAVEVDLLPARQMIVGLIKACRRDSANRFHSTPQMMRAAPANTKASSASP